MSQEDVRKLLVSLGGEATVSELSNLARERYPNRSLHTYLGDRLEAMKKKNLVEEIGDNSSKLRLTEKGLEGKIGGYALEEIDDGVTEYDLRTEGIEIANIVGSLNLKSELVLETLAGQIPNAEYLPETSPNLIYRSSDEDGVTILVHSTGRLTILGAKSKDELIEETKKFVEAITALGIDVQKPPHEISIDNIVANSELNRELDLAEVAIALELENVEYDPEQFAGLIYRSKKNPTILIFSSGKCVITGAKTFAQILDAYRELINELVAIGVEL